MTRRPRDLHLLVGVAAAFLALWTFALVTGTGRAQEPAGVTGGVEAGAGPGPSSTGGTSAPPSFTPAPPPPPAQAAPPPAAGTGGASGDAGTTAQPARSAPKRPPRPGGSSGEPPEGDASIPALKRPGDADPEPSPIAPLYRPEEMDRLKSPGGGGPKDARDVSPSYGVAAVLALSGRKAQEEPAQTTPTQTQEGEEPPAVQQGQPTQQGTESVEILPPVAPAPSPRPAPPATYGGDVVRAVAAPLRGLAATGFEPLILAALGSLFLLSGLGLRRVAA
jgi:hypothetical protein